MDEQKIEIHLGEITQGLVIGDNANVHQYFQGPPQVSTPTHVWNVPYRRNLYFTGREQVLHTLHERLTTTRTTALTQSQAISGLGGIGKTQIAVEYAYQYREAYRAILWVNAANRETITVSFLELAALLKLPEQMDSDLRNIIAAVRRWLIEHDQWLLIFDNADDLALIRDYLPTGETGSLLLTTRSQESGTLADSLDIETMNKQEGALLVLRRARLLARDVPLEQASADQLIQVEQLVQQMDGLPLALDQAAAYIAETRCTLAAFLEKYRQQRETILRRRGADDVNHPLPVATTWSISFSNVQQSNPMAADLLRASAFLAPDAIPEEMIIRGASELGPHLLALRADATQLNEAMGTLGRFSLVRRNQEDLTFSLHRLVQDVQIMDMDGPTEKTWAERVVRALNQAFPSIEATTWSQCERYLPHAQRCSVLIEAYSFAFTEAVHLLYRVAQYLYERAQYEEAEPLYQRALAINEQVLGKNHPHTASIFNNLAVLYRSQGRYEEAEQFYQRAITIYKQVPGPYHLDIATGFQNLALLYTDLGKYAGAESLYKRALAIYEQVPGSNHLDMATCLNNLALLNTDQGKYADAESLYPRSLAIREQELGSNHPDVASTLNNLAALYYQQSKYAEAEPLYQRALVIYERLLGENHPVTASALNNLGLLYFSQEKYEQAELFYMRALVINEKILGPNHPNTAGALQNLGLLYHRQGKDEQAELFYMRALAVIEKAFGYNHPKTKIVRANYINLLENIRPKKK